MMNPFEARVQELRNYGFHSSEAEFIAGQEMMITGYSMYIGDLDEDPDDYLGLGYSYRYLSY